MAGFDMHGGVFTPLGYTRINAGGSHETNPNGGVQVGVDPNGVPNMVEENESIYNDFVYSDNIYADGGILESHNLPKKYTGKLYSEIADAILKDVEDMSTDEIALRGMKVFLERLADAQEEQKKMKEQKALEEELANLSPEEMAQLEEMLAGAEGGQEAVMPHEQMMMPTEGEQVLMACGGKIHKFANGGRMSDEQIAAWQEYMGLMNAYADNAMSGNLTAFAGLNSIKDLEDSQEYRAFTKYVMDNPGDPMVNMYLHVLDDTSAIKEKLFDDNGKLKKGWRQMYFNRRTDGKDGIYHYSGNGIAGIGSIAKGGYNYAPVDNGYADTTALNPKYAENPKGTSTGNKTAGTIGSTAKGSGSQKKSTKPGVSRLASVTDTARAGLVPAPIVSPVLSDDINIPSTDIELEGIDPSVYDNGALSASLLRSAFGALADARRAQYPLNLGEISNPYRRPIGFVDLSSYGLEPEQEELMETTPRYRMPAIGQLPINRNIPSGNMTVVNPYYRAPGNVSLEDYYAEPADETFNEAVPRYRMPELPGPVLDYNPESIIPLVNPWAKKHRPVDMNYWYNTIPTTGFTNASDELEFDKLSSALRSRGQLDGNPYAAVPSSNEHSGLQAEPLEEDNTARTPYGFHPGYEMPVGPIEDIAEIGYTPLGNGNKTSVQTSSETKSSEPNISGRGFTPIDWSKYHWGQDNKEKDGLFGGTDWRRYADAFRNVGVGLFNLFQKPDELNIPTYRNRFVNTEVPNYINPVYRPTDPNLVTGDIMSSGMGLARGIRNAGNPMTASANMVALNNSINTGLGTARSQVDAKNNDMLNYVIAAKNSNIKNRADALYQQALARASYLSQLDKYNIDNNILAQRYRDNGLAEWGQAVSAPFEAATKYLSDSYLEDRRRNSANATDVFGYWMDEMLNRHYNGNK